MIVNQFYDFPQLVETTNHKINKAKLKGNVRVVLENIHYSDDLKSYKNYYNARNYSISVGEVKNNVISEILVEW
jgi:hypothetical protein